MSMKAALLVLGTLKALIILREFLRFLSEHLLPSTISLKHKYPAKVKG